MSRALARVRDDREHRRQLEHRLSDLHGLGAGRRGATPPTSTRTRPACGGYHAAPQVFYFAPQSKWYLIFQLGQPQYSTNDYISKPEAWTRPVHFFPRGEPPGVAATRAAVLAGFLRHLRRRELPPVLHRRRRGDVPQPDHSWTDFPGGFGDAVRRDPGGEGDRVRRRHDPIGSRASPVPHPRRAVWPTGSRFYRFLCPRRWTASGRRSPPSGTNPFAGKTNVTFEGGALDQRHQPRRDHPQRGTTRSWRSSRATCNSSIRAPIRRRRASNTLRLEAGAAHADTMTMRLTLSP